MSPQFNRFDGYSIFDDKGEVQNELTIHLLGSQIFGLDFTR
jgi:hypothetical protein